MWQKQRAIPNSTRRVSSGKQRGCLRLSTSEKNGWTASAHALRDGRPKVLDVALDFVFSSHEGFTRAFTNGFGISPKKYAGCPPPDGWLIPYRYLNRSKIKREGLSMEQAAVIFTQIVERPARKLILKRSRKADNYFSYCEEVGCGENNSLRPLGRSVRNQGSTV